MLGCERCGHYRSTFHLETEEKTDKKKRRLTCTKKCGCPFILGGIKLAIVDE